MVDPINLYQYVSDIPRALLVDHGFSQIGGPRFFSCSRNLMKTRRSLSQHNLSIKKPGMGHGTKRSKRAHRFCARWEEFWLSSPGIHLVFVSFLHNCQGSYWWQTSLAPQPPPNNIQCMIREACEHSEEV